MNKKASVSVTIGFDHSVAYVAGEFMLVHTFDRRVVPVRLSGSRAKSRVNARGEGHFDHTDVMAAIDTIRELL